MTAFLCSWVSRLMLKTTLGLDDSRHSKKRVIENSIPADKGNYPHSGSRTNRLPVFNEINTFLNFVTMTKIL